MSATHDHAKGSSNGHGPVGMRVQPRVPGTEARDGKFPGPSLIPALYEIQRANGWLPREALVTLSRDTRRPLYEIEGLVSFYPHFRTEPPKTVELAVCHDLSCWLHDADDRIAEVKARFGEDVTIDVHEVSCLGRCDIAPAIAVDERPAHISELDGLMAAAMNGGVKPFEANRGDGQRPNDPYAPGEDRFRVLRGALTGQYAPEDIIQSLKDSGLRGLGGAGFPTGTKWSIVRGQENPTKYVICNADESEVGSFKDRQVLAEQAHLVIEGMLLGMVVSGAEEGWIFIRHEYGPEEHVLREVIDSLTSQGLLGDDVLGTGKRLSLDIFTSPGGYILGEETALIECMEGHRGEPRNKPPFPGNYGLWGKPTLMNSVETFAHIPMIVEQGAEAWKAHGVNGGMGWKFFAVSGHVERPGVYCLPMGSKFSELLETAGGVKDGKPLGAILPGGASSNFLGPENVDVPLDWGPLLEAGSALGAGAVVVIAEGTDLLASATNLLRFFRNESCGKCVPCRVGSHKAHELLTELIGRDGDVEEIAPQLDELEATLRLTSICGLGQVAMAPVISVMRMQTDGEEGEQAQEYGEIRTADEATQPQE